MRLPISLLKAAARRPLLALAMVTATPILAVAGAAALHHDNTSLHAEPLDNPRAVLGRVWFDRYPEKLTDEAQIWVWLGSGMGVHDTGSFWRSTTEVFEFERQGDKLSMVYLQDRKTAETRFKITACEEQRPFNLCLDLTDALGGRKRYYGFGDLDDMAAHIPWSKSVLRAAEARAAGTKR
ncbi:Hypothetical protein A7982_09750 [Minicystis rosea]|nr:Hypothetical protein A7982_09750 [Minicystis rosea]